MSLVNITIDTSGLEQLGQRLNKIDLKPAIARSRAGSHMLTIVYAQAGRVERAGRARDAGTRFTSARPMPAIWPIPRPSRGAG